MKFRRMCGLVVAAAFASALWGCEKKAPPEPSKPAPPTTPTSPAPVSAPVTESPKPAAPKEAAKPASIPAPETARPAPTLAPTPAPTTPTAATTPAATPDTAAPKPATGNAKELTIQGLMVVVPDGWVVEPFQPSAMSGTVAAYRLTKVAPDTEDAILKISHFPAMKGKDADNIGRWLGQVTVDGKPVTKEAANFKVEDKGNIRLTTMDAKGAISTSMTAGGAPTPGQRMIAAIVDHPKGPHFVKVTGGEATLAKWRDSVFAMMNSAKAE